MGVFRSQYSRFGWTELSKGHPHLQHKPETSHGQGTIHVAQMVEQVGSFEIVEESLEKAHEMAQSYRDCLAAKLPQEDAPSP